MATRIRKRQLNAFERALERFAASKPGGWFFVNVANKIDPPLLRMSKGRVSLAVGQPVCLLTARGAKSGRPRATPLLYMLHGDRVVLIASKAGNARHPAWYHNVRAHPEVELIAAGRSGRYTAREAEGDERERLWDLANDVYAGYDVYQERAGDRRIPVIVLEPGAAKTPLSGAA
jgi:deazaflavin-dependent oxidoreductase (nitroreductase family)